jgi:hypothetical protein
MSRNRPAAADRPQKFLAFAVLYSLHFLLRFPGSLLP